jgi:hypothetical protein
MRAKAASDLGSPLDNPRPFQWTFRIIRRSGDRSSRVGKIFPRLVFVRCSETNEEVSMKKIIPTVGRVMWFTPSTVHPGPDFLTNDPKQPCAAMVAYVWNDRLVNLTVSDHGKAFNMTSVQLLQAGERQARLRLFLRVDALPGRSDTPRRRQAHNGNGASAVGLAPGPSLTDISGKKGNHQIWGTNIGLDGRASAEQLRPFFVAIHTSTAPAGS